MPAAYDSHYRRYDRIYKAFHDAGVPLAGLQEGTKRLFHKSAPQSVLRDLHQLEAAMDAGLNVGAITHQENLPGINPLGFWDLDIDGPDHGLDLTPFTWRVRREGEMVKAHYLARLPDPSVPLAASLKGKDYDLATWNTVLPGSVHKTGTVYELEYLEGGEWVPWDGESFSIDMLPAVDPELYRSQENQRHEQHPSNVHPLQIKKKAPKQPPVWVEASGTLPSRIKMARTYLRTHSWKSISGMNGHSALLVVMTNLRLFHCLDQSLALAMVKDYFNPRCVDKQGNPSPWSDAELLHKWKQAGRSGAYPTLGVKHPRALAKVASLKLESEVAEFLGHVTQPGGRSNPTLLRLAFIAYRGGEVVDETPFGRAVSAVTGIRTTTPGGPRVFQGFQLTEAGLGLTRSGGRVA